VILHLNGRLLPIAEARISPLDRGFVFGDGVYEGLRGIPWHSPAGRRIIGANRHAERMRRGLAMAGIDFDPADLHERSIELLRANDMTDAFVYWQVTRGTPGPGDPPRSRVPGPGTTPTIFGYCAPQPALETFSRPPVRTAISCRDNRWLLGHLKSISLMGNVLAALDADRRRKDDAIFIRDGLVAEGLATNVILAVKAAHGDGTVLVTPSLDSVPILEGVTRAILLGLAPDIEQRPVRAEELLTAREVMLVGTTTMVTSIIELDGRTIGDSKPGPEAARLLGLLMDAIRRGADD
jgi:D-alanine transaminase